MRKDCGVPEPQCCTVTAWTVVVFGFPPTFSTIRGLKQHAFLAIFVLYLD